MNAVAAALVSIVPVVVAALLGRTVTRQNIDGWYAHLVKPAFNPPNWIFAPVWALLYIAMAYALFRVLRSGAQDWLATAVTLFMVQLALNAAWSWTFFGTRSPRLGLVVIGALWVGIAATASAFWKVDPLASVLLAPYLAWVSFAGLLNWEIAKLNPE